MNPVALTLVSASIFGTLGVCAGAFGAHGLQDKISPDALASFKTGVHYQMIHALGLLALSALAAAKPTLNVQATGWLWIVGILLFSGSIYLLSLREVLHIEHWRWLGPVTPLGGLLLIGGWTALTIQALRTSL